MPRSFWNTSIIRRVHHLVIWIIVVFWSGLVVYWVTRPIWAHLIRIQFITSVLKVPGLRLDMVVVTTWGMYGICGLGRSLAALSLLSAYCDCLALAVGALVDVYEWAAGGASEACPHLRRLLQERLLAFRTSTKIILGLGRVVGSICLRNTSLDVLMVDVWSGALGAVDLRGLTGLFALEGVSSILVHYSRGKVAILHWHLMLEA